MSRTTRGEQLHHIIDKRLRTMGIDPRMALDLRFGEVVAVSTAQRKASVRLLGAETPTTGIDLHAGLGRWPVAGDACAVLRRRDGAHLLLSILADVPGTTSDGSSRGTEEDEEDESTTPTPSMTAGYQRPLLTVPGLTEPPELLSAPPDHRLPWYGPPVPINPERAYE